MGYTQDYLEILGRVLKIEGAPTNHGWDSGGETVFGISKNYWPQYWVDGPPNKEIATLFYWQEFWLAHRLPEINHISLREEIFEASVNCGFKNGAMFAQDAYNMLRPRTWPVLKKNGVPGADGDIGPITLSALNRMMGKYPNAMLSGCNYFQATYYVKLNPMLKEEALRGWFEKRLAWRQV